MSRPLQTFHAYRTDTAAKEELREIRQGVKEMLKDPARVKAFLIKGGFITKSGKLTKRYGG